MWRFPGKNREWKWAHISIFGYCPPPNFLLVGSVLFLLTSPCAHRPLATPFPGVELRRPVPFNVPYVGMRTSGNNVENATSSLPHLLPSSPPPFPTSSLPHLLPNPRQQQECTQEAPLWGMTHRIIKVSTMAHRNSEKPENQLCQEYKWRKKTGAVLFPASVHIVFGIKHLPFHLLTHAKKKLSYTP